MTKLTLAFNEDALPYLVKDADYPCGGWAVELLGWIEGLSEICDPLVMSWEGATAIAGEQEDVKFVEVWNEQKGRGGLRYFYSFIPKCTRALKRNNVDIMIQACAGLSTGLYAIAAKLAGKKFIYRVVNDIDVDDRLRARQKAYQYYFFRFGLRMADLFICQNDYQLSSLKKQFPNKPMFTIHNPYKALAQPVIGADDQEPYIAWLGVFSAQKNLPLLLDLVNRTPKVRYKIAGMPAKLADPQTLDAFEQLKTKPNVTYVGYTKRTQVPTFLANARALLNTSHYEGFSNTFLESLAVGTPIITSVGVDPDNVVRDNRLGSVVGSPEEYVQAIEQAIFDPAGKVDDVKQRCMKFVEQHHAPKIQAARFLDGIKSGLGL